MKRQSSCCSLSSSVASCSAVRIGARSAAMTSRGDHGGCRPARSTRPATSPGAAANSACTTARLSPGRCRLRVALAPAGRGRRASRRDRADALAALVDALDDGLRLGVGRLLALDLLPVGDHLVAHGYRAGAWPPAERCRRGGSHSRRLGRSVEQAVVGFVGLEGEFQRLAVVAQPVGDLLAVRVLAGGVDRRRDLGLRAGRACRRRRPGRTAGQFVVQADWRRRPARRWPAGPPASLPAWRADLVERQHRLRASILLTLNTCQPMAPLTGSMTPPTVAANRASAAWRSAARRRRRSPAAPSCSLCRPWSASPAATLLEALDASPTCCAALSMVASSGRPHLDDRALLRRRDSFDLARADIPLHGIVGDRVLLRHILRLERIKVIARYSGA